MWECLSTVVVEMVTRMDAFSSFENLKKRGEARREAKGGKGRKPQFLTR